jgi:acetyltransferase-like isoleucine patch superfamily enzyme
MNGLLKSVHRTVAHFSPVHATRLQLLYHRLKPGAIRRIKIKGKRNRVMYADAIVHGLDIEIDGDDNTIRFAPGCYLRGLRIVIRGDHHLLELGEGCRIHGIGTVIMDEHHTRLTVGERSAFEGVYIMVIEAHSAVTIGKHCMFSYDIDIRTSDSHGIFDAASNQRINPARSVTVGDRVWVGAHVLLLKGVQIPSDSVVGTGAVVTKPFKEPGVIIAGNPAREVKRGIRWTYDRQERAPRSPGPDD